MNKSWEELGRRKSELEENKCVLKETAGFFDEVRSAICAMGWNILAENAAFRPAIDTLRFERQWRTAATLLLFLSMLPSMARFQVKLACPVLISNLSRAPLIVPECPHLSVFFGES